MTFIHKTLIKLSVSASCFNSLTVSEDKRVNGLWDSRFVLKRQELRQYKELHDTDASEEFATIMGEN
ncbi:hypothetical protein Tco_0109176 [Tanacetum coccineum]